MPVDLKVLPARLKMLRESSGYTQGDFARVCRIVQSQISSYESGRVFPTLESAASMANALGTTISALIGETEPKSAPPRFATKNEMALWVIEAIGIEGFALDRIRAVLIDKVYKF